MLPTLLHLRDNLTLRQVRIAVATIIPCSLVAIASLITIFVLADLGQPSFIPWFTMLFLGVGPVYGAYEEYGYILTDDEAVPDAIVEDLAAYRARQHQHIHKEALRGDLRKAV